MCGGVCAGVCVFCFVLFCVLFTHTFTIFSKFKHAYQFTTYTQNFILILLNYCYVKYDLLYLTNRHVYFCFIFERSDSFSSDPTPFPLFWA